MRRRDYAPGTFLITVRHQLDQPHPAARSQSSFSLAVVFPQYNAFLTHRRHAPDHLARHVHRAGLQQGIVFALRRESKMGHKARQRWISGESCGRTAAAGFGHAPGGRWRAITLALGLLIGLGSPVTTTARADHADDLVRADFRAARDALQRDYHYRRSAIQSHFQRERAAVLAQLRTARRAPEPIRDQLVDELNDHRRWLTRERSHRLRDLRNEYNRQRRLLDDQRDAALRYADRDDGQAGW
jgi:hypothetical protein